jgi:putative membrane protein
MNWRSIASLFVVLMVAVLGGCERESATTAEDTSGVTDTSVTSPAGSEPADATAPTVAADQSRYLSEALQQGMGHIELAQAVSRSSDSGEIDALAAGIIETNNRINAELTKLAAKHSVTIPNDAAPALRGTIERIGPLNGVNLHAAWLAELLQRYPELIELHNQASTSATDMEVKQAATEAQSALQANLLKIQELYPRVTGTAAPATPEQGQPPPV